MFLTRLGSLTAYPFAILLLGTGQSPIATIEIVAAIGLVRASTALVLPLLHLDYVSSKELIAWIGKKHRLVLRCETAVLSIVAFPPAVLVLIYRFF